MNDDERKSRMAAAERHAVFTILGQVLSRLALIGPEHEAAIREGFEAAKENLAIAAGRPVEPPAPLDYGHVVRILDLLSLTALFECDVRARVARGEVSWSPRPGGLRRSD